MPRQDAATRARVGQVHAATVTVERPPTTVRGPDGVLFNLPRASAAVPVYQKINSRVADPVTGKRLRARATKRGPVSRVSFGTFVLAAFLGWKAFQLMGRSLFGRRRRQEQQQQQEEGQLVAWESDEEEQPLPPLRTIPAMLQRALPRLGPPSRSKQLAQQRRERPLSRRTPNARQKMQPRGAAQRRPTMLEKMDASMRQQAQELGIGAAAGAAATGAALPAPPARQQQLLGAPALASGKAAGGAAGMQHAQLARPQRQQRRGRGKQQGELGGEGV